MMHQGMLNHHVAQRLDLLEQELLQVKMQSGGVAPMMMMQQPMSPMPMSMRAISPAVTPHQTPYLPHGQHDIMFQTHKRIEETHKALIESMRQTAERHDKLLASHGLLMDTHKKMMASRVGLGAGAKKAAKQHPKLGVVRLDYNYPPGAGDIDSPASFGYDVFFRVVPGMTFEMCQSGKFTPAVERNFSEAIKWLEQKGACAITGDCGFMMAFQVLASKIATRPVFMSSMVQCPIIATAYDPNDQILILTANDKSLAPQKDVLLNKCGFDVEEDRFIIVGCQNVPGFDAVAKGEEVPHEYVQPGIVKLTQEVLKKNPRINAILLECTELPPYADALRASTGLGVWDAITGADFYVNAYKDNPRFGLSDWQAEWDGVQDEYVFGQNLIEADRKELVNKVGKPKGASSKPKAKSKAMMEKIKKNLIKQQAPSLGVVRLDYNYPPSAGDIDHPGSYDYDVIFRCVPGLTFEMAQSGRMTYAVQKEFENAIKWLESKKVSGITGDCGFMMAFQPIARDIATVPVFMSSMVQCPMVSVAFDKYDQILILTANSKTLGPQKDVLLNHCGFDVDDDRFVIAGCENVPGFDAVAKGEKVDVEKVTPGIVKMVKGILENQPSLRAIILECTELPPYADALRAEFGLPVWDAITCADFFISARKDNPRFGLNSWQLDWDGVQDEYQFGQNLSASERSKLLNK
eukprot:CAMPEP_0176105734 /NCGR_PEP_ID=MMETSP0120_2-20121206/53059_1 /TAXON_ID=160619 /ORGANISM="Kryptoperidinium foliaceum, Strain CCMP 1326" /LENGTH=691 /DNA_ID=CAMNT_0017439851 /DNA_START=65 /DNA_END=2140 /DNA_ORIENTATION=+